MSSTAGQAMASLIVWQGTQAGRLCGQPASQARRHSARAATFSAAANGTFDVRQTILGSQLVTRQSHRMDLFHSDISELYQTGIRLASL